MVVLIASILATDWTLFGFEASSPSGAAPTVSLPPGTCSFTAPSPLFVPLAATFGGVVIDDACQYVYLTNTSLNRVDVYNLQTQTLEAPIQVGAQPIGLDLTPDGTLLYVANSGGSNISVVSVSQRLELRKIITPPPSFGTDTPYTIAIGNNGRALVSMRSVGSSSGRLMDLMLATDQMSQRNDVVNVSYGARMKATQDRGSIVVAGIFSDVLKYNAATNTFGPAVRLGEAFDIASGNQDSAALFAPSSSQLGTIVLDSALGVPGRISSTTAARGVAVDPNWNIGYRSVNNKIEILNLSTFLTIGELSVGDTMSSGSGFTNFVGRMDISGDGAAIAIITDTGFSIVQPTAAGTPQRFNFLRNNRFESGLLNWEVAGTPGPGAIAAGVVGGVLEFNRLEPQGTPTEAAVFQQIARSLPASAPLEARFSLGNSSAVTRSVTVRVGNGDLSDVQSCTFLVAPGAPLAGYRMRLRTAQLWSTGAIYFYADTAGADGGFNRVDNVSLQYDASLAVNATTCTPPPPVPPSNGCGITPPVGNLVPLAGSLGEILIDDACRYVYVANRTMNRIEVFSLVSMGFEDPIQVGSLPFGFDIASNGTTMYVANSGGQNISVVDLVQRAEVRKIFVASNSSLDTPYSIAIANNGRAIFATTTLGVSGFGSRVMQLTLSSEQVAVRTDFTGPNGLTTEATRLHSSGDRGTIGLAQGDISSGPVYLYKANTDSFTPPRNLNLFLGDLSLNRTGSSIFVMPGSSVLDGALNLVGTVTGGSGSLGSAVDPIWPVGYRVVGSNLEVMNLSTFLEGVNIPLGDATNATGRLVGRVDLSNDGILLVATTNLGFSLIRPPAAAPQNVNFVQNGSFAGGLSGWQTFATPDPSYIAAGISGGVLQFNKLAPPPGTGNQAVVFQHTGVALPPGSPVQAQFDLGNSSSVRKRMSVLLLDADFSDLHVCTFWLPANTPLATYRMRSHSTRSWANAAIYFYAATEGADGGFNLIDNVSVKFDSNLPADRTECEDPTAPDPSVDPDGPDLIVNGDFGSGVLGPWSAFGTITTQIAGGVLEFIRPTSAPPAGAILQVTGQTVAANEILTAGFELGNSSSVRKRVTVLLHDADFSDLSACTFWLAPNQAIAPYTMRAFATEPWASATLSFYAATVDTLEWARLDNVSLRKTPSAEIPGTQCLEIDDLGSNANPGNGQMLETSPTRLAQQSVGQANRRPPQSLFESDWIDLTGATQARLVFESWILGPGRYGEIQLRTIDGNWTPLLLLGSGDDWTSIEIELDAWLGQQIAVRFVRRDDNPGDAGIWRIRGWRVDVSR